MHISPTAIEPLVTTSARPAPSRAETFEIARVREESLSRLLMAFITSGLIFMVFPGTLLGVWNLLQISGRESVSSISATWLQAHGHAQVFGWVGSFIVGIGFYSIPKFRGAAPSHLAAAWTCWAMWTLGVTLRWFATAYLWQWRLLLPISAMLEITAFAIFFRRFRSIGPKALVNLISIRGSGWLSRPASDSCSRSRRICWGVYTLLCGASLQHFLTCSTSVTWR